VSRRLAQNKPRARRRVSRPRAGPPENNQLPHAGKTRQGSHQGSGSRLHNRSPLPSLRARSTRSAAEKSGNGDEITLPTCGTFCSPTGPPAAPVFS
jgi:hypothetical protein